MKMRRALVRAARGEAIFESHDKADHMDFLCGVYAPSRARGFWYLRARFCFTRFLGLPNSSLRMSA